MNLLSHRVILLAGVFATSLVLAESPSAPAGFSTGPAIQGYGPVSDIPDPDFSLPTDRKYRVVFDVARTPDDPAELNRRIETVARFMNMHVRAGVKPENLELALVIHGAAGKDMLKHAAYEDQFLVENPNLELLDRLKSAGVGIFLCGQTAAARGWSRKDLAESVSLATSAMTVLVDYQSRGYSLIAF
ncbi:MAG: DsrE family protein [Xanthomonadales bacterium]|nr:DsrE family protein [Xanthomonadales bacterium]